jgi:hypothetical protein
LEHRLVGVGRRADDHSCRAGALRGRPELSRLSLKQFAPVSGSAWALTFIIKI